MILFAQQMLQVLSAELFGVAVTAGVIYAYWNGMKKTDIIIHSFSHTQPVT